MDRLITTTDDQYQQTGGDSDRHSESHPVCGGRQSRHDARDSHRLGFGEDNFRQA